MKREKEREGGSAEKEGSEGWKCKRLKFLLALSFFSGRSSNSSSLLPLLPHLLGSSARARAHKSSWCWRNIILYLQRQTRVRVLTQIFARALYYRGGFIDRPKPRPPKATPPHLARLTLVCAPTTPPPPPPTPINIIHSRMPWRFCFWSYTSVTARGFMTYIKIPIFYPTYNPHLRRYFIVSDPFIFSPLVPSRSCTHLLLENELFSRVMISLHNTSSYYWSVSYIQWSNLIWDVIALVPFDLITKFYKPLLTKIVPKGWLFIIIFFFILILEIQNSFKLNWARSLRNRTPSIELF